MDALRTYAQLKHTSGRSRRRLSESDVSRYESNIDALAKHLVTEGNFPRIFPVPRFETGKVVENYCTSDYGTHELKFLG